MAWCGSEGQNRSGGYEYKREWDRGYERERGRGYEWERVRAEN